MRRLIYLQGTNMAIEIPVESSSGVDESESAGSPYFCSNASSNEGIVCYFNWKRKFVIKSVSRKLELPSLNNQELNKWEKV